VFVRGRRRGRGRRGRLGRRRVRRGKVIARPRGLHDAGSIRHGTSFCGSKGC
jgi:hypothetical protein